MLRLRPTSSFPSTCVRFDALVVNDKRASTLQGPETGDANALSRPEPVSCTATVLRSEGPFGVSDGAGGRPEAGREWAVGLCVGLPPFER